MNWIYYAFLPAAVLHVLEEYYFPGGFPAFMKKMAPPFAPYIATAFAVVVNGLFLLLCLMAALVGRSAAFFGLSVAALLGINGVTHVVGTVRAKRYSPGLLTGVLLYLPLAAVAFRLAASSGQLSIGLAVESLLLGAAYQGVPIGCLGVAFLLRRHPSRDIGARSGLPPDPSAR